jgi:hypothetical protein
MNGYEPLWWLITHGHTFVHTIVCGIPHMNRYVGLMFDRCGYWL